MPAPDVQYVLDGAMEAGHIAGDTYYWMMELEPNANAVMDETEGLCRDGPQSPHWRGLVAMGLHLEERYIGWRAQNPPERLLASMQGAMALRHMLSESILTMASHSVDNGFARWGAKALQAVEDRYCAATSLEVIRRALRRSASDFRTATVDDMHAVRAMVDERYQASREAYHRLLRQAQSPRVHANYDDDIEVVRDLLKERQRAARRVIKRSIRFFERLMGPETTRMFIAGQAIRVEGQHAIYEIKRHSSLTESHGGHRALAVFDKTHPDLMLCEICINTPGVPLLDHVGSLIMHIKAGEEEEILKIGNAHVRDDSAYQQEWLEPFLPKKRTEMQIQALDDVLQVLTGDTEERKVKVADMKKQVSAWVFKTVIAEHLPFYQRARLVGYPELQCG